MRLSTLLLGIFFFNSINLLADSKQPMPNFNLNKDLTKKVQLLVNVRALKSIVNGKQKGIIALYETCYQKTIYKKGELYHDDAKQNKSSEKIFITGLNFNSITANSVIYQKKSFWVTKVLVVPSGDATGSFSAQALQYQRSGGIGADTVNEKCLYLWPIGVEIINNGNNQLRLRKFTAAPEQALAFYTQSR